MKKLLVIFLMFSLLVIVSLMFIDLGKTPNLTNEQISKLASTDTPIVKETAENKETTPKSALKLDNKDKAAITKNNEDCINFYDYMSSKERYKKREFYNTWGFPHSSIQPNGSIITERHPYADYQDNILEEMSNNRDKDAMYVLGLHLIWEGLGGEGAFPVSPGEFYIEHIEENKEIDYQTLKLGRDSLNSAAIHGHLYSYIDLAFSYAFEMSILRKSNQLTPIKEKELTENIYKYGMFPDYFIQGMPKTFFQAQTPESLKENPAKEFNKLAEALNAARENLGLTKIDLIKYPDNIDVIFCEESIVQ